MEQEIEVERMNTTPQHAREKEVERAQSRITDLYDAQDDLQGIRVLVNKDTLAGPDRKSRPTQQKSVRTHWVEKDSFD